MSTTERMFAVPEADLGLILDYCAGDLPGAGTPEYRDALVRTLEVWRADHEAAFTEMITPEPPLPEGIWGRIELYRNHTGWITEEPRFGQQMAVIRDWDSAVVAIVAISPGCQVVALPTPLKRPDPPKAITAWSDTGYDDDLDDDDDRGF